MDDLDYRLLLRFWGVRGSIPTPQLDHLTFGGNTACVEIRVPTGEIIIIDGGSGARPLGVSLAEEFRGQKLDLTFLLTHFHWDHIQGIPYFAPLFSPVNEVTFCSALDGQPREALEGQMTQPYFPVQFGVLPAKQNFLNVKEPIRRGPLSIHPFPMNHPQGATGYRLETGGAVIVHASDLEHGHETLDTVVRDYAQGADILVYDAQYTPAEYAGKKGWGHSTWLEATRVARDAGVKHLILFHHDPSRSDKMVLQVVEQARTCFENTDAAREGGTVKL